MAAVPPSTPHNAVPQDTLITIKISVNDNLKKLKLPLRDLTANVLPDKLRHCLSIKPDQQVIFERFSDSAGGYITLDPSNPQVFKTLIRAAKAKLKLRLKATVSPEPSQQRQQAVQNNAAGPSAREPVIVRTPVYLPPVREVVPSARNNIGSGIFQFREARASQQTLVNEEAPVPRPFMATPKNFFEELAHARSQQTLPVRSRESVAEAPTPCLNTNGHTWSVCCNECDVAMSNVHYHCSICDGGDYDLCEQCVAGGKLCPGEDHWLIKRFIKDGKVINSTTERIRRKVSTRPACEEKEIQPEIPGAFADETKTLAETPLVPTRTCNCCVVVLPEHDFVTCTSCEDYDLCIKCHVINTHGHHPGHGFAPATKDTELSLAAETMLSPGRNVRHNAICDGCDKKIYGVRHKCLNCPDWDYCTECVKNARTSHPRHRFAAIYTPIADPQLLPMRHYGIFCDGPLCNKGSSERAYITGVRYKCAVCHDTDFCASCEALPGNHHNRTHPLIKFKTPVRNVSISTLSEDASGSMRSLGDQRTPVAPSATRSQSTETTPVPVANAATQVQTVADFKPTEGGSPSAQAVAAMTSEKSEPIAIPAKKEGVSAMLLNAHFVQDSIPDGMTVSAGSRFTQIWTLRNPGPFPWPAGCSVRYVGGDNMLNVDNSRPAYAADLAEATESNVVGREVQVGEDVAFKVTLKAPLREGKSISYWRLKSADGTPFGHRLWCDVEVKKAGEALESAASAPVPAVFAPGNAHSATAAQLNNQLLQPFPPGYSNYDQTRRLKLLQQQQQKLMQAQGQMLATAHAQDATLPPAYSTVNSSSADIASRVAAMRQAQQARREAMMAHFNMGRDHLQAQGIKREDMPSWGQHFNPVIGTSDQASSSSVSDAERARKEVAQARAEALKARILKIREFKAKAAEDAKAAEEAKAVAQAEKAAAVEKKNENVRKIIEEASKAEVAKEADDEKVAESGQMVFPKLEKESPASSTYQSLTSSSQGKGKAAYVENEAGEVERSATPPTHLAAPGADLASPASEKEDFEDLTDDLEVLSADGEVSDDDGFLTDEEYDILDASDRETVASP